MPQGVNKPKMKKIQCTKGVINLEDIVSKLGVRV